MKMVGRGMRRGEVGRRRRRVEDRMLFSFETMNTLRLMSRYLRFEHGHANHHHLQKRRWIVLIRHLL